MKSIVLCESTLLEQSDHGKELKEAKANENGNEEVLNKITNGNSGEESSREDDFVSVEENLESICSRDNKISEGLAEKETAENDEKRVYSNNSTEVYLVATEEEEKERDVNCSNLSSADELDCLKRVDDAVSDNEVSFSDIDEQSKNVFKGIEAQNIELLIEKKRKSEENRNDGDIHKEIKTAASAEENTSKEDLSSEADVALDKTSDMKKNLANGSSRNMESKDKEDLVEEILLDEDENKENEKESKEDFPESREGAGTGAGEEGEEQLSGCEIQVGECQTISELDKNSVWNEKPEEDPEENFSSSTQGKLESSGGEIHNSETNEEKDVEILKSEEEIKGEEEEDMQIVLDEFEHLNGEVKSGEIETSEMELEGSPSDQTAGRSKLEEDRSSDSQAEFLGPRKRQLLKEVTEEHSAAKKKRLSENGEGGDGGGGEKEVETGDSLDAKSKSDKLEVSSRPESAASRDTSSSSKDESDSEKVPSTKKACEDVENVEDLKTSVDEKGERPKTQSVEKGAFTSSFLASLRGTLKGLTKSDLEELIIQKLCEVITERSNVGELRRKAQALEQDQERWKEKVQSLTKLVREMEMVMKKYMTEVQKQTKEGNSQIVTPLKVTRSVGLQVSFLSSANKASKPVPSQPATSGTLQNVNGRNAKPVSLKIPSQLNVYPKTLWNKPPVQKPSPSGKAVVNHQKKPIMTRSDYMHQNRSSLPQSLLHGNRGIQGQASGTRHNAKSVPSMQSPQQQKPQQQSNNSSKVIDLTEDDDRQTGSVGKTTGPIRVVNHLPQQSQQVTQNNRYAYILPASSAPPTGSSAGGQSRQVLIATPTMPQPNRQLMCSMPPLLFKGGNVVPQQGTQSQIINQSNRIIYPKTLRQHPAPLPQPPINQINRPNLKLLPPRPALKISKVQSGIVLSWNMSLGPEHAPISSYQLYAYQESNSPPATSLWKKVGDVKALPLPMACTLTQFMSGHKYHFAVRAVDLHSRIGPFSFPGTIVLVK